MPSTFFAPGFLSRRPALRDALLWAIPAIIFGAVLRLLFLHYSPFAYWGSDSRSYYDFAARLYSEQPNWKLDEKREFIYPPLLALVTLLPGAPLQWVAWLQHAAGVLSLVPLAYVVRKIFAGWRWWVVPITVLYAGLPLVLWYEHELLAEAFFFAVLLWAFAGYVAWVHAPGRTGGYQWWWFFVPFALFILTKPSARFYWPGLLLGMALTMAWKRWRWPQWTGLGLLAIVTPLVGSAVQGSWMAYAATFPLTQLQTPRHAEYKAEIRDLVEPLRRELPLYYQRDQVPADFLEKPELHGTTRPHWAALKKQPAQRHKLYMSLALEGIAAEPLNFLYLAWQRLVVSTNPGLFREDRFEPDYVKRRFAEHYATAQARVRKGEDTPIPLVLGIDRKQPMPSYTEIGQQLSPRPDSQASRVVMAWVRSFERHSALGRLAEGRPVTEARPTLLGWWLIAAIVLSVLPAYRATAGVWALAALGYLLGVFLVSQVAPRYFGAAWPVLIPLLAVPADSAFRLLRRLWERRATAGSSALA